MTEAGVEVTQQSRQESAHPRPALYVGVAAILAVVTLAEVAVFYVDLQRSVLVSVLLLLSAAKFLLVAGFYMHLKFDSPLFRWLFVVGIVFSIAIYAAVLAMFGPVR